MFNTELFVVEVQKRPCLWHVKDGSHNDRQIKHRAWEEIIEVFKACSDSYSDKNITVEVLQRKWKHLRDYYIREKKRTSKTRSTENGSSSAARKRNSPLLEMLRFLDANSVTNIIEVTIETNEAEESFFPESNEEEERSMSEYDVPNSQPGKIPRLEAEQTNPLDEESEESTDKQFLMSLLPIIKNMSARERIQLQKRFTNPANPHKCLGIDDEEKRKTTENRKRQRIRETEEIEVSNKEIKGIEISCKRDEYSIYGEYVANKLRNIRNSHARHTAEFHINGILYKAEMGEYDNVSRDLNATRSTSSRESRNVRIIESFMYGEDDSNDVIKTEACD